jgi:hypothetical protein
MFEYSLFEIIRNSSVEYTICFICDYVDIHIFSHILRNIIRKISPIVEMTGTLIVHYLQYLPQCHDVECIIHHRRAKDTEITRVSTQFDFFHDHRTGVQLWEYILFSDKSRNTTRDIQ